MCFNLLNIRSCQQIFLSLLKNQQNHFSGRCKVGTATPGFRDWAACVKDIKPTKCAPFRNVVVMCGTNDLKINDNNVLETYKILEGKVEQIREVNQHGNIFVFPVLPSRDLAMN